MTSKKFLIGGGEKLVSHVKAVTGTGDKAHPYTYEQRVRELTPEIKTTLQTLDNLPQQACPGDEAVVAVTLHPV